MIQEITETGFQSGVTLNNATVTLTDMGERTISADVKIAGGASIGDGAYLTFRGEKFVPVVKDPQALKNNEKVPHVVSVNFQSYVIAELKRYWFFKTPEAGTDVIIDTYTYPIGLNLSDFVTLFNQVLSHYYGTEIVMDASGVDMSQHAEAVYIEIDYTTVWEVLQQVYEKYEVRWKITQSGGVYTIALSNASDNISHVFSYGYDGGLTHIERQVQNEDIRNKIFGRGVDTNLPFYYFKRVPAGDTSGYQSDPDALYELRLTSFTELRDVTFRWYVRGWMQNPNHDTTWEEAETPYFYPTYQESDIPSTPTDVHDSCLYAFRAGKTDERFNPIEYVKDDASIERYGELWGKAEPDEDIFPTIKTPIVGYENNTPDEVDVVTEKESRLEKLPDISRRTLGRSVSAGQENGRPKDLTITMETRTHQVQFTATLSAETDESDNKMVSEAFDVDEGMNCTLFYRTTLQFGRYERQDGVAVWINEDAKYIAQGFSLTKDDERTFYYVINPTTGEYLLDEETEERAVSPLTIPSGHWQIEFHICAIEKTPWMGGSPADPFVSFRILIDDISLTMAVAGASPYRLFDIWVGNMWGTTKGQSESDTDYVMRVWAPILGAGGQEASVYFASGVLARSSDYDFKVAGPLIRGVAYDTSEEGYYWKLTLIKSEAEYQADGKFIPRVGIEPSIGDLIAFSNGTVVYPHSLIEDAEYRLNAYKQKILAESKDIQPAWVVKLDKVRINTLATGESNTLYSQLDAGRKMTISSETLIPDGDHTKSMFIESVIITWNDDTKAKPDVEVTLSHEIHVYHSPIEALHSDIREIEVTKVDEEQAEQTSRRVAARDSIPSTGTNAAKAAAPLTLANMLQSPDFKTGLLEGEGWSIYRDTFGNCVIEADKLVARQGLKTLTLQIDEWKHQGGVQILSAANMRIKSIAEEENILRCFFDTQNNSVLNLFAEHDIALCTRTDGTTGETIAYRYEVVGTGNTYIELSKTNHTGDNAAVGDELIQFGNTTDANRQHVIIFDAASGHERMLFGLNSINATGDVYYYAGAIQQDGTERRRWFVGDRDNSKENFIEYAWNETTQSYALVIGGDVYVGGSEVSLDALNYLAASLRDGGQAGGLILSNQIAVYTGTGQQAQVMGGINGAANAENIAAWFGGAMTTEGQTAAKVVFKFDGSGYVAANHIRWDAAGNCIIDGSVQLGASGGTVGTLLELVQGALQASQVAGVGNSHLPIYFDEDGDAHTITDLEVDGGVAAHGITDLSMHGQGGQGTVKGVKIGPNGAVNQPDQEGVVQIPEYPDNPPEVVDYEGLDQQTTEDTTKAASAHAVSLIKENIGIESLPARENRAYKRGEVFKVVEGNKTIGYRVVIPFEAGASIIGKVERLTYETLARPLNIVNIDNILV